MDSTIILTDETGGTLVCNIEDTIAVDDVEYFLLQPIDNSVQIFAWEQGEDEDDEILVDLEADELAAVFSTAQAVLSEQNLKLKRTAFTLTVEGELPDFDEEEIFTVDLDDDSFEEYQELAKFLHEEQPYSIFTPLSPVMFFAKLGSNGQYELLTEDELEMIQPYVEEHMIDDEED
ncbi:Protein of unknown function (DUF3727)/Protein of unknown function (DUF1292) [Synechococcus sp. PCC 7502]|uniref:DUF3727 domain-containing protein n=1 Tax=Synechococcus sp. PCC 7502 TaxID=1173263 RepID=UPI00029FEE3B|nr:DUF3727 domain-containing protein [Synechococcus sp. PCC 7502]AFY74540.1 Protein of unknown function (DUF3727)/Protein of unknown function (DUF1292) [Synechococcus sp. PCC 7502]